MNKAINKSLDSFIKSSIKKKNILKKVSIITCTNNPNFLNNILNNYKRQKFKEKELIIIINNNKINIENWEKTIGKKSDIQIFQIDENISLGKCLNIGASKAKFDYIAKFDDDDYYGAKYLTEAFNGFKISNAKVVGKGTTFVYFVKSKTLALRDPGLEWKFVQFVNGSTLVIKKNVLKQIKFRDISAAEDTQFCRDCINNGIKIYSTSKFNHVYMRYSSKKKHTWKIDDEELMKRYCRLIKYTDEYKKHVNN